MKRGAWNQLYTHANALGGARMTECGHNVATGMSYLLDAVDEAERGPTLVAAWSMMTVRRRWEERKAAAAAKRRKREGGGEQTEEEKAEEGGPSGAAATGGGAEEEEEEEQEEEEDTRGKKQKGRMRARRQEHLEGATRTGRRFRR